LSALNKENYKARKGT